MSNLCLVTGGGSGMGLETARIIGRTQKIVLVGRTVSKLENAVNDLKNAGIDAAVFPCDISDRTSVKALAAFLSEQGKLKTVIHAAGVSPHMCGADKIFEINAVGTINIDEELGAIMSDGCIINVSSMSAYMLPAEYIPMQLYTTALEGTDKFSAAAAKMLSAMPEDRRTGMAYSISKNFVIWYTEQMALKLGKRGVRVLSVSPGTFDTPMGETEGDEAKNLALNGALGRVGNPVEIASLIAFLASGQCEYITGTDILCDGGTVAAIKAANRTI